MPGNTARSCDVDLTTVRRSAPRTQRPSKDGGSHRRRTTRPRRRAEPASVSPAKMSGVARTNERRTSHTPHARSPHPPGFAERGRTTPAACGSTICADTLRVRIGSEHRGSLPPPWPSTRRAFVVFRRSPSPGSHRIASDSSTSHGSGLRYASGGELQAESSRGARGRVDPRHP
jgi:hypothetical protein